jgi:acetyl-CoA carboxylase biotin carboxyl carrier protein
MTETQSPADDVFDLGRIRDLIELMKEFDLNEIDLRQQEQRIRLCRGGPPVAPVFAAPQPAAVSAPAAASSPAPASESPRPAEDANLVLIRSPMVGTFYSRANPKAEPFVKVGDRVDKETTICIVEAMKVFNEIPAEISGRVVAVLVDDEEAVDFGRPLFKIDTSK